MGFELKKYIWFFLMSVVFCGGEVRGQESLEAPSGITAPPVEEMRFVKSDQPGMILGLLEFPAYSFYLGAPDINGVAYVPNFSPRLGTNLRWKDFGISLSFGLPLPPEEIERRGQSEQSNFVITRYWRNFGLDLYFQSYRGFYLSNPLTEIDLHKPDRYPQLPDAAITNYGVNFYKSLDAEKYSMSASFDLEEIQLQGGGSWIVTGFFNHLEMSLGNVFVRGSDPDSTQTIPNLNAGIFNTLGGGLGYGHTLLWREWFVTAQGIGGAGLQMQRINLEGEGVAETWSPALKANLNISMGRNRNGWVYGGKILVDSLMAEVQGTHVYSSLVNGHLFFGSRF